MNSSWIGARTHVGRSVGADVQQDGAQVGKNVLFGHVELWKGLCLNLLALLHVSAGYLILVSSLNETYRSDLCPDVTVALHKVLVAMLKQFQHLGNANADRAWRKGNVQHCSIIFNQ